MSRQLKYVSLQQDEMEMDNVSPTPKDSKSLIKSVNLEDQPNSEEKVNLSISEKNDGRRNRCILFLLSQQGKLMIFAGGGINVVAISLVKQVAQLPVGEFTFCMVGFTLLTIFPMLFFQERSVDTKGKLKYVLLRAFCGGLAGILKIWSARVMDYGDAIAIFALSPIFASIFSRILWKEKINIFTIISLILGLGGMVLIAKPSFIFGIDVADNKINYSQFFPLVPFSATILLGFAFSCMRKVGTEMSMFVIPIYLSSAVMMMSIVFNYASSDTLISPGCYSDRIVIYLGGVGRSVGIVLLNRGLAMEKSGPGTLIRNCDIVTAYLIQILFYNNPPKLLSIIGVVLILGSVVLVTINRLFLKKLGKCEI